MHPGASRGVPHPTDDLTVGAPREQPMTADRLCRVNGLPVRPPEDAAVQRPRALEVARVELMPRRSRLVFALRTLAARTSLRERSHAEHRTGRIAQRRERRPVLRRQNLAERLAPALDQPRQRSADVVDGDLSEPVRRRTPRPRLLVQRPGFADRALVHSVREREPDGRRIERATRLEIRRPQHVSTEHAPTVPCDEALEMTQEQQAQGTQWQLCPGCGVLALPSSAECPVCAGGRDRRVPMPEMVGEQRWVHVDLDCTCAKCGRANSVGEARSIRCSGCGHATEVPANELAGVLAVAHATSDRRASAFAQFSGLGTRRGHIEYVLGQLRCTLRPGHPLCPNCGHALVAVADTSVQVVLGCSSCDRDTLHARPEWIAQIAPAVVAWCAQAKRRAPTTDQHAADYRAGPEAAWSVWICFDGPSPLLDAQVAEMRRALPGAKAAGALEWLTKTRRGWHSPFYLLPVVALVGLVYCAWHLVGEVGRYRAAATHASWQPATCTLRAHRDVAAGKNSIKRYWTVQLERDAEPPRRFELGPTDHQVPDGWVVERVEPEPTESDRNGQLTPDRPRPCFAEPSPGTRAVLFRAIAVKLLPLVLLGVGAGISLAILVATAWLVWKSHLFDKRVGAARV